MVISKKPFYKVKKYARIICFIFYFKLLLQRVYDENDSGN